MKYVSGRLRLRQPAGQPADVSIIRLAARAPPPPPSLTTFLSNYLKQLYITKTQPHPISTAIYVYIATFSAVQTHIPINKTTHIHSIHNWTHTHTHTCDHKHAVTCTELQLTLETRVKGCMNVKLHPCIVQTGNHTMAIRRCCEVGRALSFVSPAWHASGKVAGSRFILAFQAFLVLPFKTPQLPIPGANCSQNLDVQDYIYITQIHHCRCTWSMYMLIH